MFRRLATNPAFSMLRTTSNSSMQHSPRGAHDVLFDHDAAHVVGAALEAELADTAALRHPGRLQVVEVVEHEPRDRQRAQVIHAGRFGAAELGVLRLVTPRDERRSRRSRPGDREDETGVRDALPSSRPCRTSSSPSSGARRGAPHASRRAIRPRWLCCSTRIWRTRSTRISAPPPGMLSSRPRRAARSCGDRQPRQPRDVNHLRR